MLQILAERFKEPSSYVGIAVFFGSISLLGFSPEAWDAIITAAAAVLAAVAVVLPERRNR